MSDTVERASRFAELAHAGQKRKYTDEPYIKHSQAVAAIVESVPHSEEMLAAAWLHDVVEDTHVTLDDVRAEFGNRIADMVSDLTDVSKPSDGNRARRKEIDRHHTALASPDAKTIKLADLIDNTSSIVAYDPDFAKVYLAEKRLLLPLLKEGDATLWQRANGLAGAA